MLAPTTLPICGHRNHFWARALNQLPAADVTGVIVAFVALGAPARHLVELP